MVEEEALEDKEAQERKVPIYAVPPSDEPSPLDTTPDEEHTWKESLDGIEVGDTTSMKLFKITIPFVIPAIIFLVLSFFLSWNQFLQLGAAALSYLFPPAGKETIIPIGIAFGFTKWQMTGLIFMVDVVCAMFVSWNLPLAKKIPLIGRLIIWIERKGSETLTKNPGLQTLSWIGLVFWVMVPFQGSGGVTASIIGRSIGMRASHVISAVGVGAVIAGLLIGTVAEEGLEIIRENWVTGVVVIAMIVVGAFVLFLLYKRYTDKKNLEAIEREKET
ncbi:MAG: small multi-drug export protein [Thermoplasmata archaeon]|nr:small multi-drug export protein [Thermoplasmata archaeon]